ncbi:hypothetical protein Tco_0474609, partial [Tanacetum coccineum]
TRNTNVDNALRSNKGTGYDRQTMKYDNKRAVNVVGARENVGTQIQVVTLDAANNYGPVFNTEPLQKERIEKTKRSKNDQKPTRNGKKTKRQEQE